jgi:hypothetical protein
MCLETIGTVIMPYFIKFLYLILKKGIHATVKRALRLVDNKEFAAKIIQFKCIEDYFQVNLYKYNYN